VFLLALTVAALAAEQWLPQRLTLLISRQRQVPSTGLALGALTIPWVAAALSAKYTRQGTGIAAAATTNSLQCLHDSLAGSVFILASLCIDAMLNSPESVPLNRPSTRSTPKLEKKVDKNNIFWLKKAAAHGVVAMILLKLNGLFSILTGIAYNQCLKHMPKTFTLGESIVVVQGIGLLTKIVLLNYFSTGSLSSWPATFAATVLLAAVVLALVFGTLLKLRSTSTSPANKHIYSVLLASTTLLVALFAYRPLVHDLFLHFIWNQPQRIRVITGWVVLLAVTLPIMLLISRSGRIPNILLRKGYHILAVSLFLPALFSQPQLLGIALAGAFAVLAVVEVLRIGNISGISTRVHSFMGSFVDERDSGVIFITHFALLVGMALPVWLSNAMDIDTSSSINSKVTIDTIWPAALAGILATGLGDAAASIIGSQFGRVPIAPKSRKTVEGTLAGAVTVVIAWIGLVYWGYIPEMQCIWGGGGNANNGWVVLVAVTVLNSLLEASTEQLDNLFIPLHYFALLVCVFR
jgi:dolichol kinase